jgi:HTH-like domain
VRDFGQPWLRRGPVSDERTAHLQAGGFGTIDESLSGRKAERDAALGTCLKELAAKRMRFGYRRLTAMLTREGMAANHKRVYRLYRPSEPEENDIVVPELLVAPRCPVAGTSFKRRGAGAGLSASATGRHLPRRLDRGRGSICFQQNDARLLIQETFASLHSKRPPAMEQSRRDCSSSHDFP